MTDFTTGHLEPRVARLETGLETLTRNVGEMAMSMKDTNQKIDSLVIAVTQAQAPKKTDWSLLITIGFFILALGSAAFWPLNKQTADNKSDVQLVEQQFRDHQQLQLHPVGMALVQRIEQQAIDNVEHIKEDMAHLKDDMRREATGIRENFNTQVKGIISEQSIINERMYARVLKLENKNEEAADRDLDELRLWRLRSMNHSSNEPIPFTPSSIHPNKNTQPDPFRSGQLEK